MNGSLLAAAALVALAAMHSVLGERLVLVPLLAQEWRIVLPRRAVDRILRFAWHLTSLAWVGLAAIALGVDAPMAVGSVCLVSAAVVFGASRSHPAWPLFLIAGLGSLDHGGLLPGAARSAAGLVAGAGLLAAAALHGYWALGGSRLLDRAIPSRPLPRPAPDAAPEQGNRTGVSARPGAIATASVGGALGAMAVIVGAASLGVGGRLVQLAGWVGVGLFTARAIGDGRFVGFTKSIRSTPFARADDRVFTPLIVFLALGAAGGLLSVV